MQHCAGARSRKHKWDSSPSTLIAGLWLVIYSFWQLMVSRNVRLLRRNSVTEAFPVHFSHSRENVSFSEALFVYRFPNILSQPFPSW